MRNIYIFNLEEPTLYIKLKKLYGNAVKDAPSITRLIAEKPSKEDIVVTAGNNIYPRMIEIKMGYSMAFLAFYDPAKDDLMPFTIFGHSIYLPMDATMADISLATDKALCIGSSLGTIEDQIIGESMQMRRLRDQISKMISKKTVAVHLEGESGIGKTAIAQIIHEGRYKKRKKLIRDVASFYRGELCENRMFGHKRGAYTGADSDRTGIFALANGTELFLDEMQDLPAEAQSMMLDVIESGCYRHQGEDQERRSEFVLMTASNVPVKTLLEEKRLRRDLWYRMNSYVISIAPLREHPEDIPLLISHWEFMNQIDVTSSLMNQPKLMQREWHGNVRELFYSLERIHEGLEDLEGNQL